MIALALSRILELGAMVMEEWPTIRVLICSVNTGSFKCLNGAMLEGSTVDVFI